jgi:hypothetical protein
LKNRYIPIITISVVLALVAAVGFLIPPAVQDAPTRVVLDNSGGRVIFNHLTHVDDYGLECSDCHHDDIGQDTPIACGNCHPAAFDKKFKAEHMKNFKSDEACLRCHDEKPTGPLSEEDRPDIESIPTRSEAFHKQCMSCHEDMGGPYGEDSCYECHAR